MEALLSSALDVDAFEEGPVGDCFRGVERLGADDVAGGGVAGLAASCGARPGGWAGRGRRG